MLVVGKVSAKREQLLDPASSVWSRIAPTALPLHGTPIGLQPTPYTRVAWKDRKIGAVDRVEMRLCHDGESLFVRLEWADAGAVEGDGVFPDGAAVAFPIGRDAPINTMGSDREWVNAWQWRGDSTEGRSVFARGIGTTETVPEPVAARAVRERGRWRVVLSRSLAGNGSAGRSVRLQPGARTRIGVAVWEGHNGERAGFKAFTERWTDLELAEA